MKVQKIKPLEYHFEDDEGKEYFANLKIETFVTSDGYEVSNKKREEMKRALFNIK